MPKENIIQRTLKGKKEVAHKYNVWVEGRWLLYSPTFHPSTDVKEWGGRWEERNQAWRLPRLTRMARKISEYDPDATLTRDVRRLLEQEWEAKDDEVWRAVWSDFQHPAYEHLYPYQKVAVHALATRPYHGLLLVLSPGLGKTPSSIVAADHYIAEHGESERILVVTLLSLVDNWRREITGNQLKNPQQWSSDPRVEVIHQAAPTPDRSVRWTVTNWDSILERTTDPTSGRSIVTGNLKEEFDLDWDVVILDESVLVKNRKAKRTQAARTLARNAKRCWLLSGSPTTRNNSDIWSQFNIVEPDFHTSFWRFAKEACIVIRTQWSQGEIIGDRHGWDTRAEYPELMFVRNQEEVFDDLPEYIHKEVYLELHPKQRKAHDDVLTVWLHELEENPRKRVEVTVVIAMLTRLQQITSNLYNLETTGEEWPDHSAKADYVEELLDIGDVEWPVLVWCHHRPGAHALRDRIQKKTKQKDSALFHKRVELVLGGMKKGEADRLIEEFKAGEIDVLILGISVGKYGHTLANAHTIITYDKTWDSDAWFQMLHRAAGARAKIAGYHHRPLMINPRCRGTVDDYIELNLAGKLPNMARMTGTDLAKILRSLGEEHVDG